MVGYPVGGDTISVTSGVVSRIEVTEYDHGSWLLAIQIDAAINFGNSGTDSCPHLPVSALSPAASGKLQRAPDVLGASAWTMSCWHTCPTHSSAATALVPEQVGLSSTGRGTAWA